MREPVPFWNGQSKIGQSSTIEFAIDSHSLWNKHEWHLENLEVKNSRRCITFTDKRLAKLRFEQYETKASAADNSKILGNSNKSKVNNFNNMSEPNIGYTERYELLQEYKFL